MPNADTTSGERGRRVAAVLVFFAAWAFFVFSFDPRCDATIAGNDAVPYAMALEDEDPARILDPHHPFFHVLAWGTKRVLSAAFGQLEYPGTWALKLVSGAGGALALALLYAAVVRITQWWMALFFVACFASTAGIRLYASVGESYWPALAAQLGLLLQLWSAARAQREPELRTLIAWTVLALVLRQDALIIVPSIALALACWSNATPTARWRRPLIYLSASGAMTVLAYAAIYGIYALQAAAPVGPIHWLTKLAQSGQWGAWGGLAPFYSEDARLPSALRLSLELTVASWNYGLLPWLRGSAHEGTASDLLQFLALILPLCWLVGSACCSRQRAVLVAACSFLGLRIVFYAWWQPGNTEYHSGHWIPILALLVMGIDVIHRRQRMLARIPLALALAALALPAAIANERSLLGPLRERHLHRQALQVGLWFAEGRRIVALDPLMSYALDRFGPIPRREIFPPSIAASETETWANDQVRDIGAGLADGVVFVRDTNLPRAFGTPPWSIEHLVPLLAAIAASPHARGLASPIFTPAEGPPEEAWALRLEPRP